MQLLRNQNDLTFYKHFSQHLFKKFAKKCEFPISIYCMSIDQNILLKLQNMIPSFPQNCRLILKKQHLGHSLKTERKIASEKSVKRNEASPS